MEYKITRAPTDELYHYGVLGMKWGVRKEAYKAAKERFYNAQNSYNYMNSHRKAFNKESQKRIKDDQIKAYKEMMYIKRHGKSKNDITVRDFRKKTLQKSFDKMDKRKKAKNYQEILDYIHGSGNDKYSATLKRMNSVLDKAYGAALKDLGFEDTKAGRDYLKEIGFDTHLYYTKKSDLYDYDD